MGKASVGVGVDTDMGVQGVVEGGVMGVTASAGGMGVLIIGIVVNGADMDADGVGECGVGTGAGSVDGLAVQGMCEGGVAVVGCGRGWCRYGQHGHWYM